MRQSSPLNEARRATRWVVSAALLVATACTSTAARLATPAHGGEQVLRVVTYNVHEGAAFMDELREQGTPLRLAFQRTREFEQEVLPGVDVLAVQELCAGEGGWQLGYLQRRMLASGGASHVVTARVDPSARTGCQRVEAIYSRHPIIRSGALQLPQMRQPRSALWADVAIPTGEGHETRPLRIYNVHLENRTGALPGGESARLVQIRAVLEHLRHWQAENPGVPVILLGDLNSSGSGWNFWHREQSLQELESAGLEPSTRERVRTLTLLPHQVDWIFSRGLQLLASHTLPVHLSDHYPLLADYALPEGSHRTGASGS